MRNPLLLNVTPESRFEVKPAFARVLAQVPTVPKTQTVFSYDEVR